MMSRNGSVTSVYKTARLEIFCPHSSDGLCGELSTLITDL